MRGKQTSGYPWCDGLALGVALVLIALALWRAPTYPLARLTTDDVIAVMCF